MANASSWSLSARQGFLVVGLFTAGLFVLCCGTGMSNIPVAALGVAVGVVGPVVIVLSTMRANRADVFGTAQVRASSPRPATGLHGRASLRVRINAQGITNLEVPLRDPSVPVRKWPEVGAVLPVMIPGGNPRKAQVLWDQVQVYNADYVDGEVVPEYPGYEEPAYEEPGYQAAAYDEPGYGYDDDYEPAATKLDEDEDEQGAAADAGFDRPPGPDQRWRRPGTPGSVPADPATAAPPAPGPGAEPAAADTVAAETVAADPVAAETVAADPVAAEPLAADPVAAEPLAADVVAAEPDAAGPEAAGTDAAGAAAREGQLAESEPDGTDASRPSRDRAGAVAAGAAVTGVPSARRRPRPYPHRARRPMADPDSVEAVVPMPNGSADVPPPTAPPEAAAPTTDLPDEESAAPPSPGSATVTPGEPADPAAESAETAQSRAGAEPAAVPVPPAQPVSDAAAERDPATEPTPGSEPGEDTEPDTPAQPMAAIPVARTDPDGPRTGSDPEADSDPAQPASTGTGAAALHEQTAEPADPAPPAVPGQLSAEQVRPDVLVPAATVSPGAADARKSSVTEPPAYLVSASYLSDGPDQAPQGLRTIHNVSVTLIVANLPRSLAFYRDLLGLTVIDNGPAHAILASGNARILLRQVTDSRPVDRRMVHLNLEVDDVHEAYERLRHEGVEFNHPPRVINQGEQLEQWAATLRDPDRHEVALTRWEVRP